MRVPLLASLCVSVFLGALGPSIARAQVALPLAEVDGSAIRIDGALRDWSAVRRIEVGSGSDGAMSFALGRSAEGLYLIAEVTDDRFVRTSDHGATEDVIVVTLAFPSGRSLRGLELWFYAGDSGRSAAVVTSGAIGARRRSDVRDVQIVEAPRSAGGAGGYTLEAFVPWSRIPGSARLEEGFGAVRLRDVDELAHPTIEREPSLGTVDARNLGSMLPLRPAGGEAAVLESFLVSNGLSGRLPTHDVHADVTGDARPERVCLVERFVVVLGGGYGSEGGGGRGGAGYGFLAMDVGAPSDLTGFALTDLTGDGKAELTLTARQDGSGGSRDVFQVISFAGPSPAMIFGIETREAAPVGVVESRVRIERGRRGAAAGLVVSTVESRIEPSTWRMTPAADIEPVLLPWGPVRERTFRWDGTRFARASERPNPDYVSAETATTGGTSSSGSSTGSTATTAPAAPTLDALIAAWRTQARIPRAARPSFDLTANLAGNTTTERLVVFGTRMVVIGTAFRDGTGWFEYGVPAASEGDLLNVSAADVTGDGRAEIFFRVRQNIGDVRREVLVIHHFTPEGFPMMLTREVAREQSGNRIENEIVTSGGRLEIRPGTARGWSASNWPYADGPSGDGVDPLLLPWRDRATAFRFTGGRLVP
jgi:hypothetical protein